MENICVRVCRTSAAAALVAFISAVSLPVRAQQMKQSYQQFEIDRGATLYSSNCEECHADGSGVPGVNLRTGQFPAGSSDDDILGAIRNGIPGSMMPPHEFPPADLSALLAYVRSLAADHSSLVKLGDAERGKALFESNGCFGCHRVGNKGSYIALNLSDAGLLHPPSYIERALLDPDSSLAAVPESRQVRAVTKQGRVIAGRRLNEDTYTIQLMDEHQNLVSLDKSDLRLLTVLEESPMPSLKRKLTDAQISDLVAYLSNLRSTPALTAPVQFGAPAGFGSGFGGRGRGRGAAPAQRGAGLPIAPPQTPQPAQPAPQPGGRQE
ncbi:MAG TPA: c-type cytochrome [Candidatus Acidoferrales bacterium]|nr:c-type cytochrome [Candidatus Acidoferrales bacterium]